MSSDPILEDFANEYQRARISVEVPNFEIIPARMSRNAIANAHAIFSQTVREIGSDYEVYALGFGRRNERLIRSVLLPENSDLNSAGRCRLEPDAKESVRDEIPKGLVYKGWIHSHPSGCHHSSGMDENNNLTVLYDLMSHNAVEGIRTTTISRVPNRVEGGYVIIDCKEGGMDFKVPLSVVRDLLKEVSGSSALPAGDEPFSDSYLADLIQKKPYLNLVRRQSRVRFVFGHSHIFPADGLRNHDSSYYIERFSAPGGATDAGLVYTEMFSALSDAAVPGVGFTKHFPPMQVPLEVLAVEDDCPLLAPDDVASLVRERVIAPRQRKFAKPAKKPEPAEVETQPGAAVPEPAQPTEPEQTPVVVDRNVPFYVGLWQHLEHYVQKLRRSRWPPTDGSGMSPGKGASSSLESSVEDSLEKESAKSPPEDPDNVA